MDGFSPTLTVTKVTFSMKWPHRGRPGDFSFTAEPVPWNFSISLLTFEQFGSYCRPNALSELFLLNFHHFK